MALTIQTYSNVTGGDSFFKAAGHPAAGDAADALIARLGQAGPVAVYDPFGTADTLWALRDFSGVNIDAIFVRASEALDDAVLGCRPRPITELSSNRAGTLFLTAFDAAQIVSQIDHLIAPGTTVITLDDMRLPDGMLTNRERYLDPLNFVTNFALFRHNTERSTRLATANYWYRYGARTVRLWLCLFGDDGTPLAQWWQEVPDADAGIVVDAAEIAQRFKLPPFTGQLFIHVVGAAGHDIVKYALDSVAANGHLSCTHDANAWPADYYAGLPGPRVDERVVLWLQNSHPAPIPAGAVGLSLMGADRVAWYGEPIPPFGTVALDTRALWPEAHWPAQFEIHAGRHFVRPRYEVICDRAQARLAHANVERTDLLPDPALPHLGDLFGKGFLLPAPILPPAIWQTTVLPTPMARQQAHLPIQAIIFDAEGLERARHRFGNLPRNAIPALEVDDLLNDGELELGYGHVELTYDFEAGSEADGWLHGLVRYQDRASGHGAETSFGAHIFNTPLTYRNEPQSYSGRPPGLTTRLFLRLGTAPAVDDTFCHLIYPASSPWRPRSTTRLILCHADGSRLAESGLAIPCGGSRLIRVSEVFDPSALAAAQGGGYVLVRDTTCRLFGYHGLLGRDGIFCLDHMFGF